MLLNNKLRNRVYVRLQSYWALQILSGIMDMPSFCAYFFTPNVVKEF